MKDMIDMIAASWWR